MRIEEGTELEIIHRKHGTFKAKAAKEFNTKDSPWPLLLNQDNLDAGRRTYHRDAAVRCNKDDVVNYFLI